MAESSFQTAAGRTFLGVFTLVFTCSRLLANLNSLRSMFIDNIRVFVIPFCRYYANLY